MPNEYTVEAIDKMLNGFHMPTEMENLIDGLVYRVMEMSDNEILFFKTESILGRVARTNRRGILAQGSYSTGTLRDEDMIDMFATIGQLTGCDSIKNDAHEAWTLDNNASYHEESCLAANCTFSDDARDKRSMIIEELFDHVNNDHTPINHRFGSIEGDGADFGVWEIEHDGESEGGCGDPTCCPDSYPTKEEE